MFVNWYELATHIIGIPVCQFWLSVSRGKESAKSSCLSYPIYWIIISYFFHKTCLPDFLSEIVIHHFLTLQPWGVMKVTCMCDFVFWQTRCRPNNLFIPIFVCFCPGEMWRGYAWNMKMEVLPGNLIPVVNSKTKQIMFYQFHVISDRLGQFHY